MRKICFTLALSIILLMVGHSFAQPPRQPTSSDSKSTFGNVAVMGLDNDGENGFSDPGVPGYIEMTSSKGDVYYLYVGYDGYLRLASEASVGKDASPATSGWSDSSGSIVGLTYHYITH